MLSQSGTKLSPGILIIWKKTYHQFKVSVRKKQNFRQKTKRRKKRSFFKLHWNESTPPQRLKLRKCRLSNRFLDFSILRTYFLSGWERAHSQLGTNYMGKQQRTSFLPGNKLVPSSEGLWTKIKTVWDNTYTIGQSYYV